MKSSYQGIFFYVAGSGSFHVVALIGGEPARRLARGCGLGLRWVLGCVGWRSARGFNCYFLGTFLLVLAKFWRGTGRLAIIIWRLDTFLIFPNFVSRSATR